jgi:hypothetical protein
MWHTSMSEFQSMSIDQMVAVVGMKLTVTRPLPIGRYPLSLAHSNARIRSMKSFTFFYQSSQLNILDEKHQNDFYEAIQLSWRCRQCRIVIAWSHNSYHASYFYID